MASRIVKRLLDNRAGKIFSSAGALPSIHRSFSSSSDLITATLFPGDGIGPEIAESVKQVRFSDSNTYTYIYLHMYSILLLYSYQLGLCIHLYLYSYARSIELLLELTSFFFVVFEFIYISLFLIVCIFCLVVGILYNITYFNLVQLVTNKKELYIRRYIKFTQKFE